MGSLSENPNKLLARWQEFVDCPARLRLEGPFLNRVMADVNGSCREVLDAAMGMGCEAIFLALRGLTVTGNEINPELVRLAAAHAVTSRADLRLTANDWRDFGLSFHGKTFDVVLLVGNSFSLLLGDGDRRRAAAGLRAVCRPGGIMVVDQRNYDYIRAARSEVLSGRFRYSNQVMYCGTRIQGQPIVVTDRLITFAYEDRQTGVELGQFDMYPFYDLELAELIMDAGFQGYERYSDFRPGHHENADFFTYVFRG
jgi:SAM-dependent methyltransferase